jgi:hypothetical protein
MKISIKHLTYPEIEQRMEWLDKNVGQRKYVLHNQIGGYGWYYFSPDRVVEIVDDQWATMFLLKFGA